MCLVSRRVECVSELSGYGCFVRASHSYAEGVCIVWELVGVGLAGTLDRVVGGSLKKFPGGRCMDATFHSRGGSYLVPVARMVCGSLGLEVWYRTGPFV